VVWNNIMIAADGGPEGITKILGLVFNGLLALLAFIMVIMGAVASYNADDACQSDSDCVPDSLILIILIGVGLMVVAGVVLAGVQLEMAILLRIGTLVMVFLSLLCLLSGLIMGISSGAVMDDMNFYYDSNYPRMRAALESADNSYCKLNKADCICLANDGPECPLGIQPKVCNDEYTECEVIEGSARMTSTQLWQNMWSIAATDASDQTTVTAQPWLENCESSGICIFCSQFYVDVQVTPSDAPNLNWKDAVTPQNASAGVEARWAEAQHDTRDILKCSLATTSDGKCPVADSTYPFRDADCASKTTEALCNDEDGCVYDLDAETCVKQGLMEITNADETGWSDIISNYTLNQPSAWAAQKTRCEMALTKHTAVGDTSTCKGAGADVPDGDAGLYLADCDECNGAPEFTFTLGTLSSPDCLNYFVGHYEDVCVGAPGSTPSDTCREEFTGEAGVVSAAGADSHVAFMVERAYESGAPAAFMGNAPKGQSSDFCGYTDEGCKAKIKNSVEGSMSIIGYIGAVFIVFFLAIIFLTLQGIKIYKGGGDDDGDDDDDDDGDDDSDE